MIVKNHTLPANDKYHDLIFYASIIQQQKRYLKQRWFKHLPDHGAIVELGNPNSIHEVNRFEEEDHVERRRSATTV